MNFRVILNHKIWSVVIILFILDFYGSIAKFIGLTRNTSIVDEKGNLPKLQEALTVDGLGTVLGAGLGTSNLITYVESAVGIGEGGRTGLTAIVCAVLMSLHIPHVDQWSLLRSGSAWQTAFTLFVLSCYGSLSKVINLARGTTIEDKHGALPGVRDLLLLDGIATCAGSIGGSTNFTTFVESGTGIAVGGRTGLTAVIAGALMMTGFVLSPFIQRVPITAAVGALVYVGFLFIPKGEALTAFTRPERITIAVMVVVVATTLSLGVAFACGLVGFWAGSSRSSAIVETREAHIPTLRAAPKPGPLS